MRKIHLAAYIVLALFLGIAWLAVAMDYGDSVAAGTYHFGAKNESCDLTLRPDHSFAQLLTIKGRTQQATGTWHKVGEGGISFSKEFISVRGTVVYPSNEPFADIKKFLGVFPSLHFRQYVVLWYGQKASTSESIGPGIYVGDENRIDAKLELKTDHTFEQTIGLAGVVHRATGTWSTGANGYVTFSKDFLKDDGQSLSSDESAFSMPGSNLQIEISSNAPEPIFHKRYFVH